MTGELISSEDTMLVTLNLIDRGQQPVERLPSRNPQEEATNTNNSQRVVQHSRSATVSKQS